VRTAVAGCSGTLRTLLWYLGSRGGDFSDCLCALPPGQGGSSLRAREHEIGSVEMTLSLSAHYHAALSMGEALDRSED